MSNNKPIQITPRNANALANILQQQAMPIMAKQLTEIAVNAARNHRELILIEDKHQITDWNLYKDLI